MNNSIQSYITVRQEGCDEVVINKSRFIGYARPVTNEEEAQAFLKEIRLRHRDATHNCYAYVVGTNAGIMRYSDDGEPAGTAGLPIIEVMKARKVVNCCVVVTRYFGGTLLGTGGLVRAYTQGCQIALAAAQEVRMELTEHVLCEVPYSDWDRVLYALRSLPATVTHQSFGTGVSFTLNIRTPDLENVQAEMIRITDNRIEMLPDEASYFAWNVNE